MIAGGPAVDESFLPSMGDEALGILSPLIYSAALDTPANRRFVGEYRKRFGKVPSYFSETNYTAGRWINEAVKAVGGNVRIARSFWRPSVIVEAAAPTKPAAHA